MKQDELQGTIIHHHVRCIEHARAQLDVLSELGLPSDGIELTCTCAQQPTASELNELLEV